MNKQRGILKSVSEIKVISETFKVQEFYLDCKTYSQQTGEPIENMLKFQVSNAKIDMLAQFQKGDKIDVFFNPKGRVYRKEGGTNGHAQNLDVWKIEAAQPQQIAPQTTPIEINNNEEGDLPF